MLGAAPRQGRTVRLLSLTASGDPVIVEARWAGTLAKPIGPLVAGPVLRARFAPFFQVRDGWIVSERNDDCFDPF